MSYLLEWRLGEEIEHRLRNGKIKASDNPISNFIVRYDSTHDNDGYNNNVDSEYNSEVINISDDDINISKKKATTIAKSKLTVVLRKMVMGRQMQRK